MAALGGGTEQRANEKNPDETGWHGKNSGRRTHQVRQLAPNGFGIFDMNGNVSEWVWDAHTPSRAESSVNPTGIDESAYFKEYGDRSPMRVTKGGSWGHYASPISARGQHDQRIGHDLTGFRLVRSLP
jgi:formylglycine-generating enzyme required for sulfatase activity